MTDTPAWLARWLDQAPGSLSETDSQELAKFGDEIAELFRRRGPHDGSGLDEIVLRGDPAAPTLAVIFHPGRHAGVRYSYEWRLRDCDDPDDPDPLGVLLVDYLGNGIQEDLETSPGVPLWEPDCNGVVHVDVRGARYRQWPQEWRARGRPWYDSERRLRTMDQDDT